MLRLSERSDVLLKRSAARRTARSAAISPCSSLHEALRLIVELLVELPQPLRRVVPKIRGDPALPPRSSCAIRSISLPTCYSR